jgi:uncharacterized protein with HEPN domain
LSRRDEDLLNEILEAAGHIARFTARGRETFDSDVTLQYATAHGLVLIGEAAGRLSRALRERHPDVPWRQIVGQRNVVVHEYDRIDLDIVWNVASDEVPRLADRVRSILEAEQQRKTNSDPESRPD